MIKQNWPPFKQNNQTPSDQRSEPRGGFVDEDQLDREPPNDGLRSSLRHLSVGWGGLSSCLLLPQRSGSGGAACPEPSAFCSRNLGKYFPEVGAAVVAAAVAAMADGAAAVSASREGYKYSINESSEVLEPQGGEDAMVKISAPDTLVQAHMCLSKMNARGPHSPVLSRRVGERARCSDWLLLAFDSSGCWTSTYGGDLTMAHEPRLWRLGFHNGLGIWLLFEFLQFLGLKV
ncbi:hypothetical protein FNV43_RR08531 [Rhamnella rubrinervis]|uniref:Uncharacterized protein n=1 Tax=Rhamnella rubrinervis TaxID=2594499 RepID=A0A8K0H9E7_9ROSA|nr:hypothetical protein FNV43_RR08531 [Rhamnella rubrinervis]